MAENEITIRLENILVGGGQVANGTSNNAEGVPGGPSILPSGRKSRIATGFTGGLSSHLFITGARRLISASGDTELANTVQETAEWGFLGSRALAGDPTAIATAAFKLAALGIQKIREYQEEQKELAMKYNDLALLQIQSGQKVIKANTVISYDSYGRLTLSNRK